MAAATGLSAANLYYCQPLLAQIAAHLSLNVRQVSLIPMVTQIGYACGLFFFVPLGDMLERRRLIVALMSATAFPLAAFALASDAGLLIAASYLIGLFASVVQVVVPMAAALAAPEKRGGVVGFVTSGMLVGILLARTISGVVGGAFGWRAMFWLAAVTMMSIALILRYVLPQSRPAQTIRYGEMMASLVRFTREQPVLREAAILGGLAYGGLSAFWTTLVFFVAKPPYHYGATGAGLFGLAGVAGALAAPIAGRIADQRSPRLTAGLALCLGLVSFVFLGAFGKDFMGLIVGTILLDLATQSNHVSNQTRIYALLPEARSRLNTVYMVTYFAGGAIGTWLGAHAWTVDGWNGVCIAGAAMFAFALIVFALIVFVGSWPQRQERAVAA